MKLHLGNLPASVSDEQLNTLASEYGKPDSAEVVKDRTSGASRGYGFVVFPNDEEARAAITGLDGKDVDGQSIKCAEARPPRDRERPRG